MLILRVIRINLLYCPFSHVCNKVATKINYVLDHHEFVSKSELITLQTAKQTTHCTTCLFSCLFVTKRPLLSTLLYMPLYPPTVTMRPYH